METPRPVWSTVDYNLADVRRIIDVIHALRKPRLSHRRKAHRTLTQIFISERILKLICAICLKCQMLFTETIGNCDIFFVNSI